MADRETLYSTFARTFHVGDPPTPATDDELDEIESALNTTLPESFRVFAKSCGSVYAPDILDAVTDRELDHPDIQNFSSAAEIVTDTKGYWDAGMPDNIIGFASDCMGNMFAFERGRRDTRPDDLDRLRSLFNGRPVGIIFGCSHVVRFVYGGDGCSTR